MSVRDFKALAELQDPPLDELALALAAEFRTVDSDGAMAELDRLAGELAELAGAASPAEQAEACCVLRG